MPAIHIHVDESGDFNFSPTGSRYYIFTSVWTYDPEPLADALTKLRFSLIKAGHFQTGQDLSSFHASDDPGPRRALVIPALQQHGGWNFASIVVDKRKVNPALYDPFTFYPKFLSMVLRFIFKGRLLRGTTQVLIYTDTLPFTKSKALAVEVAIKAECKADLGGVPFRSCHHRRESNAWLQVADYCCWGMCRKWEHGDPTAYDALRLRLAAPELESMSRGDGTIYYEIP